MTGQIPEKEDENDKTIMKIELNRKGNGNYD